MQDRIVLGRTHRELERLTTRRVPFAPCLVRPRRLPVPPDILVIALGCVAGGELTKERPESQRTCRVDFHFGGHSNLESRLTSAFRNKCGEAFTQSAGASKDVNYRNGHETNAA